MKRIESEIAALSARLQTDLLVLSGKLPGPAPRFRPQLLIPVVIILGAIVLCGISPNARKSVLLRMTMLASARFLQREGGVSGSAMTED